VVYIEKEGAIVAADLHLGLEDKLESEGISIPRTFLPEIIRSVTEPAKKMGASKVVFLGDVKHEFGEPVEAEWYSVKKVIRQCVKEIGRVEVVRGNHDNYIVTILKELGVPLHQSSLDVGGYTLIHGHLMPLHEYRNLIIGHEHPAVNIKDDFGVRHRFKAFITLAKGSRKIIVLPSVSPITVGTDVNSTPPSEFLSPILQRLDLSDSIPYLLDQWVAVKRFPKLKEL